MSPSTPPAVRLKVSYRTPQSLVGELTKSLGRGGVRVEAARAVPAGTKFIFELRSPGVPDIVEVSGTVLSVSESAKGKHLLHIRYEPPKNRKGLDAMLKRIFEGEPRNAKRRHARVPMQIRAVENRPESPMYRLHDISRGGVGIAVDGERIPRHIQLGVPFLMMVRLSSGMLSAHGEVTWAVEAGEGLSSPPRLGVQFGKMQPRMVDMLNDLVSLKAMPSPPWIARLSFGQEAVAGMPF